MAEFVLRVYRSSMLSRRLENAFDPFVRQRGEVDVVRRVDSLDVSPRGVAATIVGNDRYRTELTHEGRVLLGSCSCPYALTRGKPCKHLWALVRVCDDEGLLRAAVDDPRVEFEFVANPDGVIRDDSPEDEPVWREALRDVEAGRSRRDADDGWSAGDRRAAFLVLPKRSRDEGTTTLALRMSERDAARRWGTPRRVPPLDAETVARIPDPLDRALLGPLLGARGAVEGDDAPLPDVFSLPGAVEVDWIRRAAEAGRLHVGVERDTSARVDAGQRLGWDDGGAWKLALSAKPDDDGEHDVVTASLVRDDEQRELSEAAFVSPHGLVVFRDSVARLDDGGAFPWLAALHRHGALEIPTAERARLVSSLALVPVPADADVDPELRVDHVASAPTPLLRVRTPSRTVRRDGLDLDVAFDYDGVEVAVGHAEERVFLPETRRVIQRDRAVEEAALDELGRLGATPSDGWTATDAPYSLASAHRLADLVVGLTRAGWRVWHDGSAYRTGASVELAMTWTPDGFDVTGHVAFGDGATAPLEALVAAVRNGRTLVPLSDGSTGVLPDEWLDRYAVFAHLGETTGEGLRFGMLQVGLVDALLDALPEISHDEAVAEARARLMSFDGIDSRDPPPGFEGELRAYQRDGLGWLDFLRELGFGGCLADDMGLGKTVQVLAALEERRRLRRGDDPLPEGEERPGPSLVVAPRSLVYNWQSEAARFTPHMRVLDHTGTDRFRRLGLVKSRAKADEVAARFDEVDLVLTTYGTLRSDVELLADVPFDHVVLDESQAIKNSRSQAARAARRLTARHRLALTGTPIENHLGELVSQFEFLNPGFGRWAERGRRLAGDATDEADLDDPLAPARLLSRAVRPFLLRRTKEEVLDDLPPKTEQTLWCDLSPADRAAYDEIRDHYRQSLLGQLDENGLQRSKMHVLEALLRLRQAACHRGLIDDAAADEPSAKFDLLLDQLEQVTSTGHKALVFSQFASLLGLLRKRLDDSGTPYELLDGSTRDRAPRIERFQTDPDCRLFLVSLKAGGVGLNLTAAQYVFLLDPWWNPAAEAQAIDRAHRIGQTASVFAYRLIARDTVEERVLEMQASKRELADAVVRADGSLLKDLTREDLELLLA